MEVFFPFFFFGNRLVSFHFSPNNFYSDHYNGHKDELTINWAGYRKGSRLWKASSPLFLKVPLAELDQWVYQDHVISLIQFLWPWVLRLQLNGLEWREGNND